MNIISREITTMSSLDFMGIINAERSAAGESAHEPRKFLAKVVDELDLDETGKKFRLNSNQTESAYYDLTMDQMMLVGMRESKTVRRNVLAKLKGMQERNETRVISASIPSDCAVIKIDDLVRMQSEIIKYKEIQLNEAMKLVEECNARLEKKAIEDIWLPNQNLLRNIVRYVKCNGKMTKDVIIDSRRNYKSDEGKVAYKSEVSHAINHLIDTGELVADGKDFLNVPMPDVF